MTSRTTLGIAAALLAVPLLAAVKTPADVACPVSGNPAKAAMAVEFDGGEVYFCCGKCKAAFEGGPAGFAAKAHQQMVATGELVQTGCPFSGKKVNPATMIEIGDAEVGFCCNICKGKAEKASGDDQVDLVFGNISKGFAPAN